MALGIMDKQINLYRNVRAAAERRRRVMSIAATAAAIVAVAAVVLYEHARTDRAALERQVVQTEQAIEREKVLIEALGADLKRRQGASERATQAGFAQDLRALSRRNGNELAGLASALSKWSPPGAALRSLVYEKGGLTLVGEARDAAAARNAVRELNALLASGANWTPSAREIREPVSGGGLMEFKVAGRLSEGVK